MATLPFSSCQTIMFACNNTISLQAIQIILCFAKQNYFWLSNCFFLLCQKITPLFSFCSKYVPPGFSLCCQGWKDPSFSLTWLNRVCDKLEPDYRAWKKEIISLLFGPDKYSCRSNRSTRCFLLPELQNAQDLREARGSHFLCINYSVLEDQSQGRGARLKKLPVWLKEILVSTSEAVFNEEGEGNALQISMLGEKPYFKKNIFLWNALRWFDQLAWWTLTTVDTDCSTTSCPLLPLDVCFWLRKVFNWRSWLTWRK